MIEVSVHPSVTQLRFINKVRDLTAQLMTEVCPNVATEPVLQSLNDESFINRTANTQDDVRLDIKFGKLP